MDICDRLQPLPGLIDMEDNKEVMVESKSTASGVGEQRSLLGLPFELRGKIFDYALESSHYYDSCSWRLSCRGMYEETNKLLHNRIYAAAKQSSFFQNLPLEVRQMIYEYAAIEDNIPYPNEGWGVGHNDWRSTCKAIALESKDSLYKYSTYLIDYLSDYTRNNHMKNLHVMSKVQNIWIDLAYETSYRTRDWGIIYATKPNEVDWTYTMPIRSQGIARQHCVIYLRSPPNDTSLLEPHIRVQWALQALKDFERVTFLGYWAEVEIGEQDPLVPFLKIKDILEQGLGQATVKNGDEFEYYGAPKNTPDVYLEFKPWEHFSLEDRIAEGLDYEYWYEEETGKAYGEDQTKDP